MFRRPVVLAAVIAFIEINFILAFPEHFGSVFTICLIISAICIIICVKANKSVLILLFIPTLLLSASVPYFSYSKHEKPSEQLVASLQGKDALRYTATVDECRNYSSYSQIFVTIDSIGDVPLEAPLRARLGCYSGYKLLEGDTLVFEGVPIPLSETENDTFDTRSYLRSKKVFIDFPNVSITASFAAEKIPFLSRLKDYTRDVIYKYIPKDYNFETAAVCHAMFAGDRNYISKDVKDSFSKCGLMHILCVSGMHLAILAGACYSILSLFSVHKKTRCIIIILLCIFYTAFTGFSLSTVRACIMCVLSYIGMMSGRKNDAYISLFFSLLLICLFSPYSVLDISLILSFCSTLGIICLSEFTHDYTGNNKFIRFIYALTGQFLSNLGAVIFTLPVCAVSFGGISIMSIVSTMAVSYIFEMLLTFLLFLVFISPITFIGIFDTFAELLGRICNALCSEIIKTSEFFSHFRYASITSAFPAVFAALFIILVLVLSMFIAFDKPMARNLCISAIVILGVVFSFISLIFSIADDNLYKISYYRKNENDRELCVKLAAEGYLLINADNAICSNINDTPFEYNSENNYLFIVPDEIINPYILSQSIKLFDSRFGLKKVFVPQSEDGAALAGELKDYGISCSFMPYESRIKDIEINYTYDGYFYLSVDDGKVKTDVVFGSTYDRDSFGKDADICAFFTRKTKNQFNLEQDTKPECSLFVTRLKKDETANGIANTFGEKNVMIKG